MVNFFFVGENLFLVFGTDDALMHICMAITVFVFSTVLMIKPRQFATSSS
jgi:hypothetical protein